MKIYVEQRVADPEPCPYIAGRTARLETFYASEVSASELEELLSTGWRKFGICYFRPACTGCRACIPIRIPVDAHVPSKSERRTLRNNAAIAMHCSEPQPMHEIFTLYKEHSASRFGKNVTLQDMLQSLYIPSCPSLQTIYVLGTRLVAAGFLDRSVMSLSSVYFIYTPDILSRRPGILSVLREIELTRQLGLHYYYLGYFIAENSRMAYKASFHPHEQFDWEAQRWVPHN